MKIYKNISLFFCFNYIFFSYSFATISSIETPLDPKNQIREINTICAKKKNKQIGIINTTNDTVSFQVVFFSKTLEPLDLYSAHSSYCYKNFNYILFSSIDDTNFPKISKKSKESETAYRTINENSGEEIYYNPDLWLIREYEIEPLKSGKIITPKNSNAYIHSIKLLSNSVYLGIDIQSNKKFSLTLSNVFEPSFPKNIGHLTFIEDSKNAFTNKIQAMHANNAEFIQTTPFTNPPRIPLIIHTILLKNQNLSKIQTNWLTTTLNSCRSNDQWQHILWVKSNEDFLIQNPLLCESGIEIKEISELEDANQNLNLEESNPENDISQEFILRLQILKNFGGIVRTNETEIIHDLAQYNRCFDFYTSIQESLPPLASTEIIASISNHPIIIKALENSEYNLISPAHILSEAITQDNNSNRDIVFPANIFWKNPHENIQSYTHHELILSATKMAIIHEKISS